MRVKFRGKSLDIKNESKKRNEFYSKWNHYDDDDIISWVEEIEYWLGEMSY